MLTPSTGSLPVTPCESNAFGIPAREEVSFSKYFRSHSLRFEWCICSRTGGMVGPGVLLRALTIRTKEKISSTRDRIFSTHAFALRISGRSDYPLH